MHRSQRPPARANASLPIGPAGLHGLYNEHYQTSATGGGCSMQQLAANLVCALALTCPRPIERRGLLGWDMARAGGDETDELLPGWKE